MFAITLSKNLYDKASNLIFDNKGNFSKGLRVDASIQYPDYVVIFENNIDASAFASLMSLHGKIVKFH